MITKDDLSGRDCGNIKDLFQRFIVDAKVNGQEGQVKKYIKKLSKAQKYEFYVWLDSMCTYECRHELKDMIVQCLCDPEF